MKSTHPSSNVHWLFLSSGLRLLLHRSRHYLPVRCCFREEAINIHLSGPTYETISMSLSSSSEVQGFLRLLHPYNIFRSWSEFCEKGVYSKKDKVSIHLHFYFVFSASQDRLGVYFSTSTFSCQASYLLIERLVQAFEFLNHVKDTGSLASFSGIWSSNSGSLGCLICFEVSSEFIGRQAILGR